MLRRVVVTVRHRAQAVASLAILTAIALATEAGKRWTP